MTVPAGKRKPTRMDLQDEAQKLRLSVTEWLLSDFGIRPRGVSVPRLAKGVNMSDEDRDAILDVLTRYNLQDGVLDLFPAWWICERRRSIDGKLADLNTNIVSANKLYCISSREYWIRREYQDKAVANALSLLDELKSVIDTLHRNIGVDVEKYMPITDACELVLKLLRAWRQSDYRRLLPPLIEKERKAAEESFEQVLQALAKELGSKRQEACKGCDLIAPQLVAFVRSQFHEFRELQQQWECQLQQRQ